jgi:hypothetical protein
LAPVAAYFAAAGAGRELWDAVVWHNLAYAGGTPLASYPAYIRLGIGPSLVPFAPIYAAAALAPLALRPGAPPRTRRAVAWLLGWLGVSALAVSAGGYFRSHYFLLAAPPLVLLAAVGLDGVARRLGGSSRASAAILAAAVLAVLGHAIARDAWYYRPGDPAAKLERLYGSNPFPEAPRLGRWLAERSAPEDRAFVYGSEPELLFYARLPSASRYIFVYPLNMPVGDAAGRQREALAEIEAARPRWIVGVFVGTSLLEQPGTPPDLRAGLRSLLERDYEVAAVVPFDRARSGRVVEGTAARTLWSWRELWDGRTPWAAYVVWERR